MSAYVCFVRDITLDTSEGEPLGIVHAGSFGLKTNKDDEGLWSIYLSAPVAGVRSLHHVPAHWYEEVANVFLDALDGMTNAEYKRLMYGEWTDSEE